MKKFTPVLVFLAFALAFYISSPFTTFASDNSAEQETPAQSEKVAVGDTITLPEPRTDGKISVEEAIANRRSIRNISDAIVEKRKLSQLLWAAQGITEKKRGWRAAPSAGAKYPIEIFVFVGNVEDVDKGLYRYIPEGHKLVCMANYDRRRNLARSIYRAERIYTSPLVFVIGAVYERTEIKYGTERGPRYVHMEAGAVAENIYLQAEAMYLSTVLIGAFDDNFVYKACQMDEEKPLAIMPIGYRQK